VVACVNDASQANPDAPLSRCATATHRAVTSLLLRKTAETAGGGKFTIETRDGQDRGLTIGLKRFTDKATHIENHLGALGAGSVRSVSPTSLGGS